MNENAASVESYHQQSSLDIDHWLRAKNKHGAQDQCIPVQRIIFICEGPLYTIFKKHGNETLVKNLFGILDRPFR